MLLLLLPSLFSVAVVDVVFVAIVVAAVAFAVIVVVFVFVFIFVLVVVRQRNISPYPQGYSSEKKTSARTFKICPRLGRLSYGNSAM